MSYTFKLRRGSAVEWSTDNPVLAPGEPGFETDTGMLKIGDGFKLWSDLDYFLNEPAIQVMIDNSITEDSVIVLIADYELPNPPEPVTSNTRLMIEVVQDGVGGWNLTLNGAILDPNSYFDGVSTTPGSSSFIGLHWSETQSAWCLLAFAKNF
jgi:hypothetical protein